MSNPIKKLLGQTAIYGFSSILGRLLNYLLVFLYTRVFLPDAYGVVTELYSYAGFLLVFLTYGIETGFFRFSEKLKESNKVYSTVLIPLFISSVVFVVSIVIFSQSIANLLQYKSNPEYIIWFAIIAAADAFVSLPFAKLRQEKKAKKFAIFRFSAICLNIGLNLFFLLLCPYIYKNNPNSLFIFFYNPQIGVGYIFIANLITSLFSLILFIPDFIKIKFTFSLSIYKNILVYSIPVLIGSLAGIINEVLDRLMLKYYIIVPSNIPDPHQFKMAQIGIYGANYKLAILMTLFIQTFRYAAEPFFFSLEKDKDSKKIYGDVMKYFIIFCLFIFLGVTLYLDIAKFFIDKNYWEGLNVVPILLLANLFLGIIYNLSIWYKLTDKTIFGAYISIFGAVITIVLNIVLIPILGYFGSAWATFFCYFLMMVTSYFLGQKYFYVNYEIKKILLYFSISLTIYFLSIYLKTNKLYVDLSINTVLFFIFLVFIFWKENVLQLLKRFKRKS